MPIDLARALQVISRPSRLDTESHEDLIARVSGSQYFDQATAKGLTAVPKLDGGLPVRPVETLHLLAYATRPRFQDDLYDLYVRWGILRYLGFFDQIPCPAELDELSVSEAGRSIVGNQRRVTSEELGLGFGVLLGLRWFALSLAPGTPITVVDVDVALRRGHVIAAGEKKDVHPVGSKRPDFVLVAHDPQISGRYRIRLLECKGTASPAYAIDQLARASSQLGGLRVAGRLPAGLAVATVSGAERLCSYLLDPAEDPESDLGFAVSDELMERAEQFTLEPSQQAVDGPEFTSAAVRASWATLADFGGNDEGVDRWAPSEMKRKIRRVSRPRTVLDTPYGYARGTTFTIDADGQRLQLSYLIATAVDEALVSGDARSIESAQQEFGASAQERAVAPQRPDGEAAYSFTSDGSIFSLRLV